MSILNAIYSVLKLLLIYLKWFKITFLRLFDEYKVKKQKRIYLKDYIINVL